MELNSIICDSEQNKIIVIDENGKLYRVNDIEYDYLDNKTYVEIDIGKSKIKIKDEELIGKLVHDLDKIARTVDPNFLGLPKCFEQGYDEIIRRVITFIREIKEE